MKSLQKSDRSPLEIQKRSSFAFVRTAVIAALQSVDSARQQCVIAGHMLLETKEAMQHGDFEDWVAQNIPEISLRTAQTWMRAAANVSRALSFGDSIEIEATVIPISKLLSAPIDELPAGALEYRQAWFDFTADKTIKDCINACVVDGDPDHRMDRAMNGKIKGGTTDRDDRKAFEVFTATKLAHITTFLTVRKKSPGEARTRFATWRRLPPAQQTAIGTAFATAMQMWPAWLLEVMADKARQELKKSDAERASRNAAL
jgi:hypothetical protein